MAAVPSDGDTTAPRTRTDAAQRLGGGERRQASTQPEGGTPEQAKIGRFSVLETLGSGATGVVYAAYDPELDRKVALKVIGRPAPRDGPTDSTSAPPSLTALLRDAQAIARISHPNVCAIYEVGTVASLDDHRQQVFVAMEFIRGPTLRKWAEAQERSWREVVRIYLQAARGLAAAHRAGLVHRDFKPDNVLVGHDGRARVLDFGLAHRGERDEPSNADHRSDQFSFCAALYEGLYGRQPFEGRTATARAQEASAGVVPPPPDGSEVSTRVWAIVARGLRPDPGERYPSMADVAAALERSLTQGRRRVVVLAGGLALVAAGAVGYATAPRRDSIRCDEGAAEVAEVWSGARAQAIHTAFAQTPIEHAADNAARAVAVIDAYAKAWADQRDEACAATHAAGEQSESLLDLRMQCLEERRAALETVGVAFAVPTDETVRVAIATANGLPRLATCSDRERLLGEPDAPEDAELRERVDELNTEGARVAQLFNARLPATSDAAALVEAARTTGHAPLIARALSIAGTVYGREAGPAEARDLHEEAFDVAIDCGSDRVAHRSAQSLAQLVSTALGDPAGGLAWARQAESLVRRFDLGDEAWAHTEFAIGTVYFSARDLDKAGQHFKLAAEYATESPAQSTVRAQALERLAVVASDAGRLSEAQQYVEEATVLYAERLGQNHPSMADVLQTVGTVHYERADYDLALEAARRVLDLCEANNLPDEPLRGDAYNLIGAVYDDQGKPQDAVAAYDEAIRIYINKFGDDYVMVARALSNRAISLGLLGRHAEALAGYRRALEIYVAMAGFETIDVALTISNLASERRRSGDIEGALEELRRAQKLWNKVAPGHPMISQNAMELGLIRLEQGRKRDALAAYEDALGRREKQEFHPVLVAEARGMVGRMLWELDVDRPRALTLLRRALGAFRERGLDKQRHDLEQFIEDQRVPL